MFSEPFHDVLVNVCWRCSFVSEWSFWAPFLHLCRSKFVLLSLCYCLPWRWSSECPNVRLSGSFISFNLFIISRKSYVQFKNSCKWHWFIPKHFGYLRFLHSTRNLRFKHCSTCKIISSVLYNQLLNAFCRRNERSLFW